MNSSRTPQVAGRVDALPALWRASAQDPNYTPSAYVPDRYRAEALNRCAADLEAVLASHAPAVGAPQNQKLEHPEARVTDAEAIAPGMPLAEAMDFFAQFWDARTPGGDWTVIGVDCECGNCRDCGMSYALSWTHALLSNPSLAAHAERLAKKRAEDSRC